MTAPDENTSRTIWVEVADDSAQAAALASHVYSRADAEQLISEAEATASSSGTGRRSVRGPATPAGEYVTVYVDPDSDRYEVTLSREPAPAPPPLRVAARLIDDDGDYIYLIMRPPPDDTFGSDIPHAIVYHLTDPEPGDDARTYVGLDQSSITGQDRREEIDQAITRFTDKTDDECLSFWIYRLDAG